MQNFPSDSSLPEKESDDGEDEKHYGVSIVAIDQSAITGESLAVRT